MAVWFLRRAGIVLTLFFRITYCEYDLLENLQPKRNDPPELTDFLKSVLHKKDEFKKIREAAKHLRLHTASIDEDVFLNEQDDLLSNRKTDLSHLKHINRNFKPTAYRTSNKHHPLNRRSGNSNRPINDVYPYMYDENETEFEPDEREERSSWKVVREKKHNHYINQRNRKRYRRGLDLTDYSSDKDFDRGNIKVFPRSKAGFRIVPGNRYQQKRDTSTNLNQRISEPRQNFLKGTTFKQKRISQILGSSPFTEREIPNDFSAEHDILGFKAESSSESDTSKKESKLYNDNTPFEDINISRDTANSFQEIKANLNANKLLYNRNLIDHTESTIGGRNKRSMKLNIIDHTNLIKSVTQDNSAKSVILTLGSDKPQEAKKHLQRKTVATSSPIIDFERLHKVLHFGKPYIKIHENPSHAIDISKPQEVLPDILIQLDKQNKEQNSKHYQNFIKQNDSNGVPLEYQVEEEANSEKDDYNDHSPEQKKNMLQDVDEPTSAIEQYELSTKPYIMGVPRSENIISSFDVLKKVTDFLDPIDATTNKGNKFIVKDTRDMIHGKNKKSLVFIEKRTGSVTNKVKEQENKEMPTSEKLKQSNDYNNAINSLRNKLDGFSEILNNRDLNPENQLIQELSKIKRDTSKSGKSQLSNLKYSQDNEYNYYQDQQEMEPQSSFQARKLQSFYESETDTNIDFNDVSSQNTRYGYLDYENGRSNRMRKPGFTENKIRVKRDLTDLFGMSNEEDYSEDLINDYNPSVKQERSDYTYEEEGDSAVPEKQTYANKKKNKNKFQNKYQNTKLDDDFTTTQIYSSITTELPTTSTTSNVTSKMSETKVIKRRDYLNNPEFNKVNVNTDNSINLDRESNRDTDNTAKKVQQDAHCSSCKNNNKQTAKNEKCENCKTSTSSGDDENCKNCNRKIRSANENEQKPFTSSTTSYSDKSEKLKDTKVENLESSDMININIRSNNQTNSSTLKENVNECDKNSTFHSKTVSNNTSLEESNKPAKEEANSDNQVEYKFDSHENTTSLCNDEQTNLNKTTSTIMNSTLAENGEPLQERGSKKNMYSETEPEEYIPYETNYRETAGFAHHPLKTKKTQNRNDNTVCNECTLDSKDKVDAALNHYHTKHNQNEFNENNPKPEHEELPDLETIAERNNEANFEELFRDNNNQAIYQNLPAHSIELDNHNVDTNIKKKKEKQNIPAESNEDESDAEFSLQAESFRNSKINSNLRGRQFFHNNHFGNTEEGSSFSQTNKLKRDITDKTAKKITESDKKQNYAESSMSTNTNRNAREKKHANSPLLNSVDSFADIVEERINNKKVNKRQTNQVKVWNKSDMSNKIKGGDVQDLHNIKTLNGYANEAPFEKFSKLNQGYWKKNSARIIRRPLYSQFPYNRDPSFYQNEYNKNKLSSVATNFKHDLKYTNILNNMMSKRRLHNVNTDALRRIRRDQFSKIPDTKAGSGNNENSERQETKTAIPNMNERKSRNKGECIDKHDKHGKHDRHKIGMKEWLSPKEPNTKQKQCLLAQDTGLNPSFGLKSSKGSCNDEAELERGSKDYSQLHDALNGHLASLVVQTTFKRIKEHQQLKSRFSHGLARKHGFKGEMKDLNAFRNNETEGDVKHTEEMLHQIMTVLNKIILDQVRRRTCKHLPPELQKYLASLTKTTKKVADEDAKISEEGFPLPLVKGEKLKENPIDTEQGDFLFNNPGNKPELEADEEEIRKKMKMIKELLDKYKHMSNHCQTKVEDVEAYLKKHLCLLKKILQEIKQQRGSQGEKSENFNVPNKLKRKNYDVPPGFGVKQPDFLNYNQHTQKDLINKQLDSIGLGPSRTYKPTFNLDKLIENAKNKMKYKSLHDANPRSSKNHDVNSKSNYRNEENTFEQIEDNYENPKNEHKRETVITENRNRPLVSEKYRKLVQAAESLRRKRASEERLGKLFGKTEKRSIKNENYETIKSMNKKYQDYSHVGFEAPVVLSLKK